VPISRADAMSPSTIPSAVHRRSRPDSRITLEVPEPWNHLMTALRSSLAIVSSRRICHAGFSSIPAPASPLPGPIVPCFSFSTERTAEGAMKTLSTRMPPRFRNQFGMRLTNSFRCILQNRWICQSEMMQKPGGQSSGTESDLISIGSGAIGHWAGLNCMDMTHLARPHS
jgi:hypothetical protein